jgi:hypothetical protein
MEEVPDGVRDYGFWMIDGGYRFEKMRKRSERTP